MSRSAAALLAAVLFLAPACSAVQTVSDEPESSSRNLITTADLRAAETRDPSVYAVIRRLRPHWLQARATTPAGDRPLPNVFVDNQYYGNVGALQTLTVEDVERIRYLRASEATRRYGDQYPGMGAIVVETR